MDFDCPVFDQLMGFYVSVDFLNSLYSVMHSLRECVHGDECIDENALDDNDDEIDRNDNGRENTSAMEVSVMVILALVVMMAAWAAVVMVISFPLAI